MSDQTSIEWTATVNPDGTVTPGATWPVLAGCKECSPGCAHCYAARLTATRLKSQPKYRGLAVIGQNGHPHFTGETRLHRPHLDWPLRWRAPRKIFVANMSDLFYEDVRDGEILDVFRIIAQCPQHTFQVLTKRAARMRAWFARWADVEAPDAEIVMARGPAAVRAAHRTGRAQLFADMIEGWGDPPEGAAYPSYDWAEGPRWWPAVFRNVWLGVSVESQRYADERIPELVATPAAVRFLSVEPLLGPVDLSRWLNPNRARAEQVARDLTAVLGVRHEVRGPASPIDWVIVGGESGPSARPCDLAWVRSIVAQCRAAGVAVFFKQTGSVLARALGLADRKGGDVADPRFPKDLAIREFPHAT